MQICAKKQKNDSHPQKTNNDPIPGAIDEGLEVWYNELSFAQDQTNIVNFNVILGARVINKTENTK